MPLRPEISDRRTRSAKEDFEALIKILSVLAVAGIFTSIVQLVRAVGRLAGGIADFGCADAAVRARPEFAGGLLSANKRGEILSRFSVDMSPSKGRSRALPTARRCRSSN